VAKNVTGTSEISYLFGASYSWGVATNSVGIIPLDGNKMLYEEARESLWDNFEKQGESIEGRTLALINIQYDSNTANFFVIQKHRFLLPLISSSLKKLSRYSAMNKGFCSSKNGTYHLHKVIDCFRVGFCSKIKHGTKRIRNRGINRNGIHFHTWKYS